MSSNAALKGALSTAISGANAKGAEKSEGDIQADILAGATQSAQDKIALVQSKADRQGVVVSGLDEQIANTSETIEESSGDKGGSKTTVANPELKELKTERTQALANLTAVKADVEDAKAEAQEAATAALAQSGINAEIQAEMDGLTKLASNIQSSLSKGEKVDDAQITKLTDGFAGVSDKLTKDDNKGGVLTSAFYKPMAEAFEEIADLLDVDVPSASPTVASTPNTLENFEASTNATTNANTDDSVSTDDASAEETVTAIDAAVA